MFNIGAGTTFASALLTMRGVMAFWLLWGLAFVLMLWTVSPGRTLQDAISSELLQGHLAGGYQLRNPPLYEWLLWAMQQIIGPGPLSYLILRYSLIGVIGILFYLALLRTVASARTVAAFSLSLILFYWFGWEVHHSVSHTLPLLAASLSLFVIGIAYAEQPTAGGAFLLGVIIGIGLMAKWSFVLVVLSLSVAFAVTRQTRAIYGVPLTLLVLVGAVLPILPFALWIGHFDPSLIASGFLPPRVELSLEQKLDGAIAFVTSIPLVLLPWIVFVVFFAWRCPQTPSKSLALSQAVAIRLASITALIFLAVMAVVLMANTASGSSLFGITRFAIHYLFPFCLFASLALSGFLAPRVIVDQFAPRLGYASLAIAIIIFLLKLGSFYVQPHHSGGQSFLPYARLGDQLTRRGLGTSQFVTLSPRDAGNLAIYLPSARALSVSARIEPPPPDPVSNRPCVLFWGGEYSVPPEPLPPGDPSPDKLLKPLGIAGRAKDAEDIIVYWRKPLVGPQRRSAWHFLRGADVEAVCRRVAAKGIFGGIPQKEQGASQTEDSSYPR